MNRRWPFDWEKVTKLFGLSADRLLVQSAIALLVALQFLVPAPLVVLRARAAEPNHKEATSDEEIYGKYAIGPKTPTPLDQAVEALNRKIEEFSKTHAAATEKSGRPKTAVPPLTVEEVVATIRNWDRTKKPVADESYRIYDKVAKTRILPPHSQLELIDQWFERGSKEQRFLQIRLEAMTGKDHGDGFVIREHELDQRPIWPPRPGYRWLSRPQPSDPDRGWVGWSTDIVRVKFDDSESDALVVIVNRSYDILSLQVVALDENEKRYDFDCRALGAYGTFLTERFRLDDDALPREKVKYIGIEAVTRQALPSIANAAADRAKAQQIDLLPLPEVGRPYDFSLTAAGKRIDSRKLRGKVVVVDLWASWCAPCLKKMPELMELYGKWHDKGLEVIGISFDEDPEEAQAVIDRMELPWPSAILPPKDTAVGKLWSGRDQITYLPTVLIIDTQGILRFELTGSSAKIEEKLEGLFSETTRTTEEARGK
jgi:thiol-disulfide isomerase/thioredoxin